MNKIEKKVTKIIEDVKNYGDKAIVKYTKIFDGIKDFSTKNIRLKVKNIKLKDKDFIKAIRVAIRNVKNFHFEEYKNLKKYWLVKYNGLSVGQIFKPVDSVGIYIPGGKYGFNYISSLLMTIIPAKIAKVKNIVVTTPPKNVTKYFLYTLKLLGIKEVYCVGGVQAIASLAFGTETVPKVDMIVGPGNIWVQEAKRKLIGIVGFDLIAGPSEVVVVADEGSDVKKVAFELLAQAEHDKNAKSCLISLDEGLVKKVKNYIRKNAKEFLSQINFIFEKDIKNICKLINEIAPEHLTIFTKKYKEIIKNVNNVGAIFYGEMPSAVFGDYIAGPSHVLPTNKTARFFSGLCVISFLKKISIVKFTKKAFKFLSKYTQKLAEVEGMFWHRNTVS